MTAGDTSGGQCMWPLPPSSATTEFDGGGGAGARRASHEPRLSDAQHAGTTFYLYLLSAPSWLRFRQGLICNFKVTGTAKIPGSPVKIREPLSILQRALCISSQAVILTKFRYTSRR